MSYIGSKEFYFEVSKGNVAGHDAVLVGGLNVDLDIGVEEDIWSPGGKLVELTSAEIIDLTSDSAQDAVGQTGISSILVVGLDGSGNSQFEFVTMTGLTIAKTLNSYLWVQTLIGITCGSFTSNVGNITATATTSGTIQCGMPANTSLSQNSQYKVPTGKKAYMVAADLAAAKDSGGSSVITYRGLVKNAGATSPWVQIITRKLDTAVIDQIFIDQPISAAINAGSTFKFVGTADANNTEARTRTYLVVVDD